MKLDRVEIKNFRSIQDVVVDLNPACRVLVGINESGKTNILRALRLLSDDYSPSRQDDMREALPDEDPVKEARIRFIFKLEASDTDEVYEQAAAKVLASAKNPDITQWGGKPQSLKAFCACRDEGLYQVNLLEESKHFSYWVLGKGYSLLAGWKKPSAACPADFSFEANGETYTLSSYVLVRAADFSEIPVDYLEDARIEDLSALVGGSIINVMRASIPDVLFWEYDEDNLLPSTVAIQGFAADPSSCVPLRNMFVLAGIQADKIQESIEDARKGTDNQFQNYLDRIAKKTTTHFRDVWKEYKNIEFSLRLNADHIIPGIKEENTHDLSRRSDGFKRFVTFLLLISVNVKADKLTDTLLLIDEPDVSLHPSGARYLRDELLRIAKKNYVVYSTHSIFMIDAGEIGRHYIVKKTKEVTTIEGAHDSNIADEEVLYNALGHSVFAVLKENNIVFEGWNDKRLFSVALGNASASIKKKYKDVGMCHAKGVGTIKAITPMMELAQRSCVIVSDGDKAAKEGQKIYKRDKGYGEWMTYQDIDATLKAITGEDFVKSDFIAAQVNALITGSTMPTFPATEIPDDKGKLAAISQWLITNGMTSEQARTTVGDLKGLIFEHLEPKHIDGEYDKILNGITIYTR